MIIHLGDETRAEVISSVLGQLSDGIWESSNAMHKYWMFADVEGTDLIIDDEPENGGTDYRGNLVYNGFYGKSEKQIKDWFANKAKQVVKIWAEDESKDPKYIWNRANDDDVVDYMGGHKVRTITVADVYECYDFLKGRSGKKYGIAADPLPYEVECSTRRTFTKYPSNYVQASSTLETKNGVPYKRYYGYSGFQKLNIPENRYVLDVNYFHQYAEGVTGQNTWRKIYTTPEGFRTKSDAREFMKLINLKPYSKKGRNTGYGSVGAKSLSVDIIPANMVSDGWYNHIGDVYLFNAQDEE